MRMQLRHVTWRHFEILNLRLSSLLWLAHHRVSLFYACIRVVMHGGEANTGSTKTTIIGLKIHTIGHGVQNVVKCKYMA